MHTLKIKNILQKVSKRSSVIRVDHCPAEWKINHNKLRHSHTDYFNIGYYQERDNPPCYLMEQRESALVLLLISRVDGRKSALLNLRYEPGLIGGVNLTATIQSTPSNYQQKHGGKPTPFVNMA
jgi:oxidase EvaA